MIINYALLTAGILICIASAFYRKAFSFAIGAFCGFFGLQTVAFVMERFGLFPNLIRILSVYACLICAVILGLLTVFLEEAGLFADCFVMAVGIAYSIAVGIPSINNKWNMVGIVVAAGVGLGWFGLKHRYGMHTFLAALCGSLLICYAVYGLVTQTPGYQFHLRLLRDGLSAYRPYLIGILVLTMLSVLLLNSSRSYRVSYLRTAAGRVPDYSIKDMMWKQVVFFILAAVLVFLWSRVRLAGPQGNRGLFAGLSALTGRYPVSWYAVNGILIGMCIFFTWHYGVLVSFLFQLVCLLWVPFSIAAHNPLFTSGNSLELPVRILALPVFWGYLVVLKRVTGWKNAGAIFSILLAVGVFPYGVGFLLSSRYLIASASMYEFSFWGAIGVGYLITTFFCDPEISSNQRGRYEKGNAARYCHDCGERRKAGYIYCGTCGAEFRKQATGSRRS